MSIFVLDNRLFAKRAIYRFETKKNSDAVLQMIKNKMYVKIYDRKLEIMSGTVLIGNSAYFHSERG